MEEKALYLKPPVWLPLLVALVAGSMYVVGKYVETRHMTQFTISVQGQGTVNAVPDIATLNFGVQTGRQKTADGAMKMLTDNMTSVIEAVKAAGVEEKDITTQYLSLNPAYDWNDGRRVDQGFEANQSLMVKVRDLEKISAVLDAAVRAGANQAGSVGFTIDDPEELKAQAREDAIADAKMKAEKLAGDLGVRLGRMQGFWEESGYVGSPMMMRAEAMDMAGGYGGGGPIAPPVPAGEQEVSVSVNITYRIW
ncbi:MAG: SIMPL domain-containing protein [Candidatus Peregrinibacteria bacterium]|nr:SIMPL domain-containing protein [Candidatus Peregrinibacteria bacterium]MCB9807955.1 SIMPL domain-containing protein [Candidatus Peribacteria bacterium]